MEVKVGPDKKAFTIHKSVLCNAASYFKVALEGNFIEAQNQILELPEDDPAVFERFQLWLYTDRVLEKTETIKDIPYSELVDLYLFSDIRSIATLQNAIIDHIIDKESLEHNCPPIESTTRIYQTLPPGNSLRRLCVDMAAGFGNVDKLFTPKTYGTYHPDYVMDVAVALYHMKGYDRNRTRENHLARKKYHVTTD